MFVMPFNPKYMPPSQHRPIDIEKFYDINTVLQETPSYYTLILKAFNANTGQKHNDSETSMMSHGVGVRNDRGQILLDFFQQHKL